MDKELLVIFVVLLFAGIVFAPAITVPIDGGKIKEPPVRQLLPDEVLTAISILQGKIASTTYYYSHPNPEAATQASTKYGKNLEKVIEQPTPCTGWIWLCKFLNR